MKMIVLIILLLLLTGFRVNIEPEWEIPDVTTIVSGDDVPRRLPNERHAPSERLLVVENVDDQTNAG